eukprot:104226-Pyramimonas_sp.AAC.1
MNQPKGWPPFPPSLPPSLKGKNTGNMTKTERGSVVSILVSADRCQSATADMGHGQDRHRQDPATSWSWSPCFFRGCANMD